MSEVTQAYSPAANFITASGVDLAPLVIRPSHNLWRIELVLYSTLWVAASIAIVPFFLTAFYWPLVWFLFSLFVIFVVHKAWLAKNAPPLTLSVQKNIWRLQDTDGDFTVIPVEDILLWSWIIILPLRHTFGSKQYCVVALKDSMSGEDWRKLRVWLRTGLRSNG